MSNGFMFTVKTFSPLHAGIGQSIGKVDLPIEREKHTEYPCVFATGLKGSLRSHCKGKITDNQLIKIFGSEEGDKGAGSVVFTDLKLLLFPVRSSEDSFKYVTCNQIIERFKRDYHLIYGKDFSENFGSNAEYINNFLRIEPQKHIILEDFVFKKKSETDGSALGISLNKIYVIDEDIFKYLVLNATQIIARNKLDDKSKTSENVWYEEALPADTILYTFVRPSIASNGASELTALSNALKANNIIQIGGNETVGYGIAEISIL